MRTQGKNREKPWKNEDFFEGMWKSPPKMRLASMSGGGSNG